MRGERSGWNQGNVNQRSPGEDTAAPMTYTKAVRARQGKMQANSCQGGQVVTMICDLNPGRHGLIIFNDSATKNLFIAITDSQGGLSLTGGVRSFTDKIAPGGRWTPPCEFEGRVWAVFDGALAADEAVRVTEFV